MNILNCSSTNTFSNTNSEHNLLRTFILKKHYFLKYYNFLTIIFLDNNNICFIEKYMYRGSNENVI